MGEGDIREEGGIDSDGESISESIFITKDLLNGLSQFTQKFEMSKEPFSK
jgi:hypothetical protein